MQGKNPAYVIGECMGCYSLDHFCERDTTHNSMCLKCIDYLNGYDPSYHAICVLQVNTWNTTKSCYACLKRGITIDVSVCDIHLKECHWGRYLSEQSESSTGSAESTDASAESTDECTCSTDSAGSADSAESTDSAEINDQKISIDILNHTPQTSDFDVFKHFLY